MQNKLLNDLLLSKCPLIMGVVNVTPDSFSDGGDFFDTKSAIAHALKIEKEGADIIDVGGESARPGSLPVSTEDEIKRVLPVIEGIRRKSKVLISIDTTKYEVAKRAVDAGANIVNDISAGRFDDKMLPFAGEKKIPICLMHMKGTPKDMQKNVYYDDLIGEIRNFFIEAIKSAKSFGVRDIIIDPGIGFGKSADDNITILKRLSELKIEQYQILIGTSRKSFFGAKLGFDVKNRLESTLATLYLAYRNGASIFRVHDVLSAKRFLNTVVMLEG